MAIKFNPISGQFDMYNDTGIVSVGDPIAGSTNYSILSVGNAQDLAQLGPLTDGQLLIGSTGNAAQPASLSGTSNQITVTPGAGSISLSLPQDIATSSTPTFASLLVSPSGGIDTTITGTLAIGTGTANIINIGGSGATVNVQGDTFYQNVTNLQVTDKLITINKGGSVGSASNSGIEVEENSVITAYIDTTADRNGWELKAPNQNGVITFSPGSSGFTINQGSHDPVTLTSVGSSPNGNGASLSTQALTLQPADGSNPGLITAGTQTIGGNKTFNGSISASNLSNTNTGDVTLTAVGSSPNANSATLSGQALTLQPADGSNPGLITAGTQTIGGDKTFSGAISASNLSNTNTGDITLNAVGSSPNADGASLSSQSLTLQPADGSNPGLITAGTQTIGGDKTFSGAISASNLSGTNTGDQTISLSGDVSGSGTGSITATLATVNASPGSFGSASTSLSATVNGKGLITALSSQSIQIAESQVTNLVTDLGNKADKAAGDISPGSWSGMVNNTLNQAITGLFFSASNVSSFETLMNIYINASSPTYTTFKLIGTRKSADWTTYDLQVDYSGDVISGLNLFMNTSGQVYIDIGNISGFVSGLVKYRAITLN